MANVPPKGQTELNVEIGLRMQKAMENKHLTHDNLAELTGIERVTLTRYINGQRQCPTVSLVKIASACGVSTDFLLGTTDILSQDHSVRAACEFTGLSELAVQGLHSQLSDLVFRKKNQEVLELFFPPTNTFDALNWFLTHIDFYRSMSFLVGSRNRYQRISERVEDEKTNFIEKSFAEHTVVECEMDERKARHDYLDALDIFRELATSFLKDSKNDAEAELKELQEELNDIPW